MSKIKGFIPRVVHEFYANLSENIDVPECLEFEKVFVRGHLCEFSPKEISDLLKIPMYGFDELNKTYIIDVVALERLRTKSTWHKTNSLRASEITLKYSGLHKIAMSN